MVASLVGVFAQMADRFLLSLRAIGAGDVGLLASVPFSISPGTFSRGTEFVSSFVAPFFFFPTQGHTLSETQGRQGSQGMRTFFCLFVCLLRTPL